MFTNNTVIRTQKAFWQALRNLVNFGWKWKIKPDGAIRLKAPGKHGYGFCPITAVSYQATGIERGINCTTYAMVDMKAGPTLHNIQIKIIHAADRTAANMRDKMLATLT